MRRAILLAVALYVVAQCVVFAAEQPTGGKPDASVPATAADPRLNQKITYEGGYKRLRQVTEELSKQTGVAIYCGKNDKDWRVRDIPVVSCVKDMPLGKLLRAIAEATHLSLSSRQIQDGDNTTWTYRLSRGEKEEVDIDRLLERRHQADLQRAMWQWDAMVAYGKSQPFETLPKDQWLVARLAASLGSSAKERLLSGDTLSFRDSDPSNKGILTELCGIEWPRIARMTGGDPGPTPSGGDVDLAELQVRLNDFIDEGRAGMNMSLTVIRQGSRRMNLHFPQFSVPQEIAQDLNLSPYPEPPVIDLAKEVKNPRLVLLSQDKDWDCSLLKAKIDIEQPEDCKEPALADLVRGVASASGINIVIEDFASQMHPENQQVGGRFKKQTSVAESLRALSIIRGTVRYNWLFNESDRLIVGWAGDDWRDHHRFMLPEAYLKDLKNKLNGRGVDMDDVIHVSVLPQRSFSEWIDCSKDLQDLYRARCDQKTLWQLYDSLKPSDKLLAQSKGGIRLEKLDVISVADLLRRQRLQSNPWTPGASIASTTEEQQKLQEERDRWDKAMADPEVIATMVMRVEKTNAESRNVISEIRGGGRQDNEESAPVALKLFNYRLLIDYKQDGKDLQATVDGARVAIPVRSPEREAEILKDKMEKEKPVVKPEEAK